MKESHIRKVPKSKERKFKNIEKMPFLTRFLQKTRKNSFPTRKMSRMANLKYSLRCNSKRPLVTIFLFRKEFYLFLWKSLKRKTAISIVHIYLVKKFQSEKTPYEFSKRISLENNGYHIDHQVWNYYGLSLSSLMSKQFPFSHLSFPLFLIFAHVLEQYWIPKKEI